MTTIKEVVSVNVTELVQRGGSFSDSPQWEATVPVRSSSLRCSDEAEVGSGAELVHAPTPGSWRLKTPLAILLWGRHFIRIVCFFRFAPGQKRRHQSGRMNSIKQVPTRVRSRRVEANLGAEREHFEKQQVNAEKGGWSLWLCFCEKTAAVFTPAAAWLPHRVCTREDGTGHRTHLLHLENYDFSVWMKHLGVKNTLKGVYVTMRALVRRRVHDVTCHAIHSWLKSVHHAHLVLPVWPPSPHIQTRWVTVVVLWEIGPRAPGPNRSGPCVAVWYGPFRTRGSLDAAGSGLWLSPTGTSVTSLPVKDGALHSQVNPVQMREGFVLLGHSWEPPLIYSVLCDLKLFV